MAVTGTIWNYETNSGAQFLNLLVDRVGSITPTAVQEEGRSTAADISVMNAHR